MTIRPRVVEEHLLGERVAEAHDDAALDLPLGERRVDGETAVDGAREVEDVHAPGLHVHLDAPRQAAANGGGQSKVTCDAVKAICSFSSPYIAREATSARLTLFPEGALTISVGAVERRRVLPQKSRRVVEEPVAHALGGLDDGPAGHVRRARGVRADVERRVVGVGREDEDALDADAQHLRRHLREDGVAPRAEVRRADQQVERAVLVRLHGRRAHVVAGDAAPVHRERDALPEPRPRLRAAASPSRRERATRATRPSRRPPAPSPSTREARSSG